MMTRSHGLSGASVAPSMARVGSVGTRLAVAVTALFWCGCGPGTAEVTGTVKVDGKPMAGLQVEFAPADQGGAKQRPAYGVTEPDGKYTLTMKGGERGAVVGKHTVRVSNMEGGPIRSGGKPLPPVELAREVSSGPNVIDIDLTSK